ncbi:MAG: glycosyltransferase family 39 protein [Cyanobacteria bacterium P01_H01_bin.15]
MPFLKINPDHKTNQRLLNMALAFLVAIGISLRFISLDYKVFWGDEVRTFTRIAGYPKEALIAEVYNNQIMTAEELSRYLVPEQPVADTWKALLTRPEHPPLYYLSARYWTDFWQRWFPFSIAMPRSLSAVISLLVLPGAYFLALELFNSPVIAKLSLLLIAFSPVQILYAQEARQYSLWTAMVLLSSLALLRALRRTTPLSWTWYTLTLIGGIYSHLLFGLSILAQGLYTLITTPKRLGIWIGSVAIAILTFTPWLRVSIMNAYRLQNMAVEVQKNSSAGELLDKWFRNINLVLLNVNLASYNFILVGIVVYALYVFCRKAPQPGKRFLLLSLGLTSLTLMLIDLWKGGTRSTRIRYMLPGSTMLQLILVYVAVYKTQFTKTFAQKLTCGLIVVLWVATIWAGTAAAIAPVSWNKSLERSVYYLETAKYLSTQPEPPLVITDEYYVDLLILNHHLSPETKLLPVGNPETLELTDDLRSQIFLFSPSDKLRETVNEQLGGDQKVVVDHGRTGKLWQLETAEL